MVQPRPTQPRWSRGRTGQVSLCFGSYWTSASTTTVMIRGDSRRKERQAELLCRWSLVFWPECRLQKARLSPVSLAAPYRSRPGAGHRGALQTGCPRWPVNEPEGPHEPVKKGGAFSQSRENKLRQCCRWRFQEPWEPNTCVTEML